MGTKSFIAVANQTYDKIIVTGGGMAAMFTAYEILKEAQAAGKKLSVTVIADKLAAPVAMGTQVYPDIPGFYEEDHGAPTEQIVGMLRDGITSMKNASNAIESRSGFKGPTPHVMGYEIKADSMDKIIEIKESLIDAGLYTDKELVVNSNNQTAIVHDCPYSMKQAWLGQLNVPQMLEGLKKEIEMMGGEVRLDTKYLGHERTKDGIIVHTNKGDLKTNSNPLLATGAIHQASLPGFCDIFNARLIHTGALTYRISGEDAKKITPSGQPMAFCWNDYMNLPPMGAIAPTSDGTGDYMINVMHGDLELTEEETQRFMDRMAAEPDQNKRNQIQREWTAACMSDANKQELQTQLVADAMQLNPVLAKYKPDMVYGAMLTTENKFPVVGRMKDCDIMGAWYEQGAATSMMAAKAYAKHVVHGNDKDLRILEDLHKGAPWARPAINDNPKRKVSGATTIAPNLQNG